MTTLQIARKISFFLIFIFPNALNVAQATITQSPLYLVTSVDPNVLFNMSVESPMGGAAYNDQPDGGSCGGRVNDGGTVGICYFRDQEYLGYFDPDKCYDYSDSDSRFNPASDTINAFHECSGKFSGNFLNWATMTAMDMFVWTMTGGNRIDDGADNTTVVRRVRKQNVNSWFPRKLISATRNVAPSTVTPWGDSKIYVDNTSFGVEFGTSLGGNNRSGGGAYDVDVRLCNKDRTLEDNCAYYADGDYYKPEGLIQKNADSMRFAVTSYSNTNSNDIDGGVLRSNMKYVGATMPDGSGGTIANPNAEINADGTLNTNPNPADATASGVSYSGVITYLNKFSDPGYKGYDPASELFYESIRYYKNLGPTAEYLTGANGGFPIIGASDWQDPIQYWCQDNFIIGMNDANPWKDKKLPGTYFTSNTFNGANISDDFGQPSSPDGDINVRALTNTVGDLEGLTSTAQCIGCTAADCNGATTAKHISGLGEVFGSCPYTPKQNSYYIAGLAYYANTQDIRTGSSGTTDFPGKQTVSTFMIDSQEYSLSPLVGPMNMLWLAGKYGGFIDENGDNDPNNGTVPNHRDYISATRSHPLESDSTSTSEWDSDGDNSPDNYVLATQPTILVTALNQAFKDIISRTASSTSLAANSSRLDANSRIYQASFNSGDWTGQLKAFNLDTNGAADTEQWDAANSLPAEGSRNIFSYNPSAVGTKGISFEYTNLSTAQKALLDSDHLATVDNLGSDRVDYIRGDQSEEQENAGGSFRNRSSLLGDIVNSSPLFSGTLEDFGYSDLAGTEGNSYITYRTTKLSRTPALLFGGNDGMFHGINANTGAELFAYVPDSVIGSLNKLTSPLYGCDSNGCIAHTYFVDGQTRTGDVYIDTGSGDEWHTLALGSLGAGGKGLFALNVSTPSSFAETDILWEISTTQSPVNDDLSNFQNNLGYTIPQASIVRLANGKWGAIVANGYESASNKAVLYIIDIETGGIIKSFDTGAGSAGAPNGLSTPLSLDTDGDRILDTIYAGDLLGNLWKFDVSDGDENNWNIAYSATPLFVAKDANNVVQPITTKPSALRYPYGGIMVFFGTGKYYAVNDQIVGTSPQVQTFYGLRDYGTTISARSELQQQTIDFETSDLRVISDTTVVYSSKKGWYLDLESPVNGAEGERSVSNSVVDGQTITFSTLIPDSDPCGVGRTSWLMRFDAINGSRIDTSPFDIDGDGDFDEDDYLATVDTDGDGDVDADDKLPSSGIKFGTGESLGNMSGDNDTDVLYGNNDPIDVGTGIDNLNVQAADPRGRQSWRQLR